MGHSRRVLVCLALVFSGCLGTDTDHTQPIDTGVVGAAKVPTTLANRIGQLVVSDPTTVPAPELCAACTVTAEPQTERVIIYDDRDGSILGVIASKSLPAM